VADRLAGKCADPVGDHTFNPDIAELFAGIEMRPAAVLVPVIDRAPEATLLLTVRADGLSSHGGQIAFPGGRIDAADGGPEAAALREAEEEIGLDPRQVQTLCRAPDYLTGSGFRVSPVLGIVAPGFTLQPNPREVADVFEVPLGFVMDPTNHRRGSRLWRGATRHYFEMPFKDRYIWGITAGILRVLYERLYDGRETP
jgi:8-oxo-dGTP pyrophosphatase MutT (NUDIX family)